MEDLPFVEQQKIIRQYLKWYFEVGDFEIFSQSIVKRKDFEYMNVILSPDCQKLAVYDQTHSVIVYDLMTNKEIVQFKEKFTEWFLKFTHDSLKLVFWTHKWDLIIFDIMTASFEKKYAHIQIDYFIVSKSDYTLALISKQDITISTDTKEIKKTISFVQISQENHLISYVMPS